MARGARFLKLTPWIFSHGYINQSSVQNAYEEKGWWASHSGGLHKTDSLLFLKKHIFLTG
jgi:hypothetical protein